MASRIVRHGVAREKADHRDRPHLPAPLDLASLPRTVDLRPADWTVWTQGGLNSCTAQAICAAEELVRRKEGLKRAFEPSRLFLYYNERAIEGKVDDNAPVYMRDGFKTLARTGVCPESDWPYDETRFAEKPPKECYGAARPHRALRYLKVKQDLAHMRACLNEGYAFTIALVLYAGDGLPSMPMSGHLTTPDPARESAAGGHALLVVGYDEAKERFLIRNSIGADWGEGGYGTLPYSYAANPDYADSLWTLRIAT